MPTFPLLADPAGYRPHTLDLIADPEARAYWIEVFEHHLPSLVRHAVVSDARPDAPARAEAVRQQFQQMLNTLRHEPGAYGGLSILRICRLREQCLREHGFDDPYAAVKHAENEQAIKLLADLLAELDATDEAGRSDALVCGVLAGNLFDLGAKGTAGRFDERGFDFHAERQALLPRPWVFDDLDRWRARWRAGPHRRAIVFVDNAGADVVLGMMPLVREMLRRGTQVIVTANSAPALNDITHDELVELVGQLAGVDDVIGRAHRAGALALVASGNDAPLIDLREISDGLADAASDPATDLVILEGMGRAIETNLHAVFTCDALKLAVVKEAHLAQTLGGRMYDIVCRYDPVSSAAGGGWAASHRSPVRHTLSAMADSQRQAERVFEGAKFAVDRVAVSTNDGRTIRREMVVHPGAVLVLPVLDDGRVVMIRNARFAVGEELWELCAGTLEAGEDPADCAGRELIEETGYQASRIEPLAAFYTTPGICDERMHAFVATGLRHVGQRLEPTEKIRVEPLGWPAILDLAKRGEIRDGKTLAALLYYHAFGRGLRGADPAGGGEP